MRQSWSQRYARRLYGPEGEVVRCPLNFAPVPYCPSSPGSFFLNRFPTHPTANIRAIHGRREVLEGPAVEDIVIIEFPGYDAALAWYHSREYQTTSGPFP